MVLELLVDDTMTPCSVCGSNNVQVDVATYIYPEFVVSECVPFCADCGHELEDFPDVDEAILEWNEDPGYDLEELERELGEYEDDE